MKQRGLTFLHQKPIESSDSIANSAQDCEQDKANGREKAMSQDCGCKVMTHPIDNRHGYIEFCALHQAAPELVELSKKALIFIKIIGGAPGQLAESLEETINTAEGR